MDSESTEKAVELKVVVEDPDNDSNVTKDIKKKIVVMNSVQLIFW